jgi:hypothetical protein
VKRQLRPITSSAKQFISHCAMIVLLAIALVGGGCATTSSQTASAPKPHKPQMLTDEVERGGFDLPDEIASVFEFLDFFFPRPAEGSPGISWR